MEKQLEKIPSQQRSGLQKYSAGVILREQPDFLGVASEIALSLRALAVRYSIALSEESSAYLAQWIMDTYPCETLETLQRIFKSPPQIFEKGELVTVWRITPDTITKWMTAELERQAAVTEKQVHNSQFANQEVDIPEPTPETQEMLKEFLENIEKVESKKVPSLSQDDIEKEGQEVPPKPKQRYSTLEDYKRWELHNQYIRENYDTLTGYKLPTWISEEEWLKLR